MADPSNKIHFLECENKLLLGQQQNYKELCKVLTQRHVEILKYLSHLKNMVEKIISFSKENVIYANYYQDKTAYETNILKYDKQIQALTDSIQSSQARISDNEGNLFKEHMKLLSNSLVDLSQKPTLPVVTPGSHDDKNSTTDLNNQKFRCDYFDCSQEFLSKNLLDSHVQNQHIVNYPHESGLDFYNKKTNDLPNESKMNEVLFSPQMELEVLDSYNNSSSYGNLTTTNSNQISSMSSAVNKHTQQPNGYKKMAPCEYCGKYFNKHYLASHKRSHTGARPYKCSIDGCNRTFTQTSSRNVHEKRVHNPSKLDFKCNYLNCGASFTSIAEMQKHFQQHQALINTVMTHQFDQINVLKNDSDSGGQAQHIVGGNVLTIGHPHAELPRPKRTRKSGYFGQNHHNGVQNNSYKHVCQHCGKAFAYKVAMKQHMALHGPKNFRCTYENCNYASYWKHNLGLHLKKHHNQQEQQSSANSTNQ